MAVDKTAGSAGSERRGEMARQWHYIPPVPIKVSPFFTWPLSPMRMAVWLGKRWLTFTENVIITVLAILTWLYLQPPLEETKTLEFGWIAMMYIRNLVLMFVVAGGLHLYFHRYKRQGDFKQFDNRPLRTDSKTFTFNNQVYDNMFWTLGSGVAFWTAYEALMLWAMANEYIPVLQWSDNPVWFVVLLLLTPLWISLHFFLVHFWLHWPPAYKWFHSLHHRNVIIGPWSGLSMHPVEHLIYFSSILIHCMLAAHPIHILFHMQNQALMAITSHTGFEGISKGDRTILGLGNFHHQIHHRYFDCNYGNLEVPADIWTGTFHDGTDASHALTKERRRKLQAAAS